MTAANVAEVEVAADRLVAAFAQGRLDDYFDCFAPDATFVFHTTPERLTSVAQYRALWQEWVEQDGFEVLACDSTDRLIQFFTDSAIFTHTVYTRSAAHGVWQDQHERETIVFRLIAGRWLAVHEHLSPNNISGPDTGPQPDHDDSDRSNAK
ncbi:ketosteroid isomerase-like protein [Nocardia sp. GAS34]|uniref:nuclear transport factor 2 family protein n=1 Tax=unclassified Nocardia TaxID=2637762 RepID=UPI003D1ADC2D